MRITGSTRLLGLIGWPVAHSRSPVMHAAAIRAASLDLAYVPMPVEPTALEDALRGLSALGFLGCNVTIPHKERTAQLVDALTGEARLAAAVNTIRVEPDGSLTGHNTDIAGVRDALESIEGLRLAGGHVTVLGAGGAARAAAVAAAVAGASRVLLLNRSVERARAVVEALAPLFASASFHALPLTAHAAMADTHAVVQTTALGMKPGDPAPVPPESIPPNAVLLETVYAFGETPLLRAARARGLRCVDGLEMLVAQGAASFRFWTGLDADRAAMRAAVSEPTRASNS